MEGVPLPPDEERCRRRGTPNWRCPRRALPGKSHCLKHYLFYVSRRNRRKTTEGSGGGGGGGEDRISGVGSTVEPYRPVIDFDLQKPPVHGLVNDRITLGGGGWTGQMIMGRFGDADIWNAGIALVEPAACGLGVVNDRIALGGERNEPRPSDGIELKLISIYPDLAPSDCTRDSGVANDCVALGGERHELRPYDGMESNIYPDVGLDSCIPGLSIANDRTALGGERYELRPSDGIELKLTSIYPDVAPDFTRGSGVANDRTALAGESYELRPSDGIEVKLTSVYPNVVPGCTEKIELGRPKRGQPKGSKSKKKGRIDCDQAVQNPTIVHHDQGARIDLVAQKSPTIFNAGNYTILPKKRGRPKGSKNKLKIYSS